MDYFDKGKTVTDDMIHDFYKVIMPSFRTKQRTVNEAIGDLPKIFPLPDPVVINGKKYSHAPISSDKVKNHIPRFHSARDISVFRMLEEDIETGRNEYVKIDNNEPSNTIPAHLYKDGMRHIHPDSTQARSITVREAARLQTFPDDFEFLGANMAQYKMVGNAVPVDFARIVAEALYSLIDKYC